MSEARSNSEGFRRDLHRKAERGVVTDQFLISQFAQTMEERDIHPVCTDSFIGKSKAAYDAPWLVRELVQNFVDHNNDHPGTLNGVELKRETSKEDDALAPSMTRFTITGHWPFRDPTGIISPHSEKPEGMETAGGNGIGLKQAALRFLRDFGVRRFAIDGEGWRVDYDFVKAEVINEKIRSVVGEDSETKTEVKHDWLTANVKKTKNKGEVRYIIETDNPEIIEALASFHEVGVHEENRFLRNPDVQNKYGSIKWLPATEHGRLFINGQAFHYLKKGPKDDPWRGPTGVTVRLNNLPYEMSIDRPPVPDWLLESYLSTMVRKMSESERIVQIRATENLWADRSGAEKTSPGALTVVKKMVSSITCGVFAEDNNELESLLSWMNEQKYLAVTGSLSDREKKFLEEKGYKICPDFFKDIGVPTTERILNDGKGAASEKPSLTGLEVEQRALREGVPVGFEKLSVRGAEDLARLLYERISHFGGVMQVADLPNSISVRFPVDVKNALAFHPLHHPRSDDRAQGLVSFARAFGASGLANNILKDVYFQHGDSVVTLAASVDEETYKPALVVKIIRVEGVGGKKFTIHFVSADDKTHELFLHPRVVESEPKTRKTNRSKRKRESRSVRAKPSFLKRALRPVMGLAALFGVGVMAPSLPDLAPDVRDHFGQVSSKNDQGSQEALYSIKALIEKLERKRNGKDPTTQEYRRWLKSGDFYSESRQKVNYFGGASLQDTFSRYQTGAGVRETRSGSNQAEIAQLQSMLSELETGRHVVEDFKIIENPTKDQIAKLVLLKAYFELVSGANVDGKLFLFSGSGTTGINFSKESIGIHENLLGVDIDEAVKTFTHEVAHSYGGARGHGLVFVKMEEALFTATSDRLYDLAKRAAMGEPLSESERVLLLIEERWDALR